MINLALNIIGLVVLFVLPLFVVIHIYKNNKI